MVLWWPVIIIIMTTKIKTWEMVCNAVTILIETTLVGSVLSASKRSLASLLLPLSLSPFMHPPLPLLLPPPLDLTLFITVMVTALLALLLLLLPLSHSPSHSIQLHQQRLNLEAILVMVITTTTNTTTPGGPGFHFSWPRKRRK